MERIIWICLILLLCWYGQALETSSSSPHSIVSIVSIVNPVSIHVCMIKLHSIIGTLLFDGGNEIAMHGDELITALTTPLHSSPTESSGDNLQLLNFKFLLFDGLGEEVWNQLFCECFCNKLKAAGATYETVEWREVGQKVPRVSILRDLVIKGGHKFNTERLFARFYLPYIFTKPHTTRMFYVDNDAVVTADLSVFATEAYNMTVTDHRTGNSSSAAVGFVYDKAIFNKFYMATHFHLTHRWWQQQRACMGRSTTTTAESC